MAKNQRDSFTFHRSFFDAAKVLDGEVRVQFIHAIIDYGLNGEEPALTDKMSAALFADIRPSIDAQNPGFITGESTSGTKKQKRIKDCSNPELFLTTRSSTREAKAEFIKRYILNKEPFNVPNYMNTLSTMPYNEFLKTPYWRAIATYVRNREKRQCQICGKQINLCVHHKTYRHHGDELNHLDDLMCVCNTCHQQIHENKHKTDQ